MKTTEKDALHIVAIVRALHDAQRFLGGLSAEEFAENDEKQNAVAMAIARAGEHARKLSKEFRESKSGVPWRGVSGMRDWIAHDYDGLDFDRLYYAVTHEVPEVLAVLQPYVEQQAQVQLTKRNPFDVPRILRGKVLNMTFQLVLGCFHTSLTTSCLRAFVGVCFVRRLRNMGCCRMMPLMRAPSPTTYLVSLV